MLEEDKEEEFQRRLQQVMSAVDCPYCEHDLVDNKCPSCGHDPSTRGGNNA